MPATIIVRLIGLIMTSHLTANDIAAIIRAVIIAAQDVAVGRYMSAVEAIAAQAPEALPLIETAANLLFPGSGAAIDILVHLTGNSHRITPAEEQPWFDRQNPTPGL